MPFDDDGPDPKFEPGPAISPALETVTSTWTSRYPRVYTRPMDRPNLPFGGLPEVVFRHAWEDAFLLLPQYLSSDMFFNQIPPTPIPLDMAVLASHAIDTAGQRFARNLQDVITHVLIQGALDAKNNYAGLNIPVTKASPIHVTDRYIVAARKLTGRLITDITADQKARVQSLIVKLFEENKGPRAITNEIASIVGLNERWATAVQRLRANMVAHNVKPALVEKRTAAYTKYLLKKRGEMIARTEMMTAMNAGRLEFWLDSAANGTIDGDQVRKQWVTAPGACIECLMTADPHSTGQPNTVVGLMTPFDSPWGPILYPPLHPLCRCTVNYLPQIRPRPRSSSSLPPPSSSPPSRP